MKFHYDIIVIGAGHAGCEAATAAAQLGSETLLITMDMDKIAQMSCNPAIGGIAKGQIVREIDALGGRMGEVSDATSIQFRMLNRSKGAAMWSPRAQSDRNKYSSKWRQIIENQPNLFIWQDTVKQLIIQKNEICGVQCGLDVEFHAKCVILTTGTFLNGLLHIGKVQIQGGRISEQSSYGLTEQLNSLGMVTGRMKTGTPVRIDGRSLHFSEMDEQIGDNDFHKFSFLPSSQRELQQLSCWTLFTNTLCHDILHSSLNESPLYNGQIQSIGPRYCPSIEAKIVTFPERDRHQLFLEPEGENSQEYYLNGFSSSLPLQIQLDALRSIPALRDVQIYRPGYAIEYDYFDPTQLWHSLETKLIRNLFLAGQINGTTGYEEAAGQGLIAGINAHLKCHYHDKSFTLKRDEAYIGVLIDDLVTKGVDEPYRMFTSRAEYRILLRQDNADIRLTEKGKNLGLASKERLDLLNEKKESIAELHRLMNALSVKPKEINSYLERIGSAAISHACRLTELLGRPHISIAEMSYQLPALRNIIETATPTNRREEIVEETEIGIKYHGYIARERLMADKLTRLEDIRIKGKFQYSDIQSLSTEARQKLERIDPETIAQASRIPGISPNDINVLLVLMGR